MNSIVLIAICVESLAIKHTFNDVDKYVIFTILSIYDLVIWVYPDFFFISNCLNDVKSGFNDNVF